MLYGFLISVAIEHTVAMLATEINLSWMFDVRLMQPLMVMLFQKQMSAT